MQQQVQLNIPKVTPVVKFMLITCGVMFLVQMTAERFFQVPLSHILGFVPSFLLKGWIWQPFTYVFLHGSVTHILLNLLTLWLIGSDLEAIWGSKFFAFFLAVCSFGAAITYAIFAAFGFGAEMLVPVIGCSGAVFGLLLAYGIIFSERTLYFFMIFPIKAKYFVMLIGGIVLFYTVFYTSGGVAHTAHLGGMLTGLGVMMSITVWRRRSREEVANAKAENARRKRIDSAGHLRLVKDDDDKNSPVWH